MNPSGQPAIQRFGVFEASFESAREYPNPLSDASAQAVLTRPDGKQWRVGLFWDGGTTWRFRVSPDLEGPWSYVVESSDAGLTGQSGSFQCVESELRGTVQPMKGYPHHFQYQSGEPVFFFGDTNWRLFCSHDEKKLNRLSVQRYIDRRASQGFNYIHADMLGYTGEPRAFNEGGPAFLDKAQERINPAYFQEADARLRYLNDKGIVCGLIYAWADGKVSWETFANDEARLRYARYLTARYAAFNTVLIVSGEWGFMRKRADLFKTLGEQIRKDDPHGRMMAIHAGAGWRNEANHEMPDQEWFSFGEYLQAYQVPKGQQATAEHRHNLRQFVLQYRRNNRPVVNSEYAYYLRDQDFDGKVDKPHSHSREAFRRASWMMPMAGAYFVTGFGTTYFGGHRDAGPFNPDAPQNVPAENDLQNLCKFFTGLEWWLLEPVEGVVTATGQGDEPAYAYCLRSTDASKPMHVVYLCEATRATLVAGDPPTGGWSVRRFDTRTGEFGETQTANTAQLDLTPPDADDWVYLISPSR